MAHYLWTGNKYVIRQNGQLHVIDVSSSDSGSVYKCETKHRVSGETVVTQNGGKLHVTAPSSSIPPRILRSETVVKAKAGRAIILPCVAHGYPPPKYR